MTQIYTRTFVHAVYMKIRDHNHARCSLILICPYSASSAKCFGANLSVAIQIFWL